MNLCEKKRVPTNKTNHFLLNQKTRIFDAIKKLFL